MEITIFHDAGMKSYTLSKGKEVNKIWINTEDGEGADFDADIISQVIFNAIDKFFKENH